MKRSDVASNVGASLHVLPGLKLDVQAPIDLVAPLRTQPRYACARPAAPAQVLTAPGWSQAQIAYVAGLMAQGKLTLAQANTILAGPVGGFVPATYPQLSRADLLELGVQPPPGKATLRNLSAAVQSVLAGEAVLTGLSVYNGSGATAWVQLFDAGPGLVVLGTTAPDWEIEVFAAGNEQIAAPLPFANGIQAAATTAEMGSIGAGAGVVLFVSFK